MILLPAIGEVKSRRRRRLDCCCWIVVVVEAELLLLLLSVEAEEAVALGVMLMAEWMKGIRTRRKKKMFGIVKLQLRSPLLPTLKSFFVLSSYRTFAGPNMHSKRQANNNKSLRDGQGRCSLMANLD